MPLAGRRRSARLLALPLLALLPPLAAGGCSAFRSRFPRHEDVFKPVPLTIGELRVEGTDSLYAVTGRGYEILAPSRELLLDAQKAIDIVGRAYIRYFDAEPRPIVVRLQPVRRDWSDADRDSAARARRQPLPRDARGRRVVVVPVFLTDGQRQGPGGPDMPLSTFLFGDVFVAQAWLAAYADAADSVPGVPPRPRRLPDWLAVGAAQLLAPRPYQELGVARLNERQKELIPLRTLFDSVRAPAAQPDDEDEGRRERVEAGGFGRRRAGSGDMFAAQSLAVVHFLVEREGAPFIGRLAERLVRGDRPAAAFAEARSLPQDVDAIDGQFRGWLEEVGARLRRMRG